MVWGWNPNYHVHISHNDHILMGFNEPNHSDQANMSPQEAAQHWRTMQSQAPGRQYVSPAAAPGSIDPTQWFADFFASCHGCQVDYLATHAYWCDAHQTMNYLQGLYNRFHKKIWLTEFACQWTHSADEQLRFMKQILPMLEAADYVDRYSWFILRIKAESGFVTKSASLVEPYSSQMTPLGRYYNDFAA